MSSTGPTRSNVRPAPSSTALRTSSLTRIWPAPACSAIRAVRLVCGEPVVTRLLDEVDVQGPAPECFGDEAARDAAAFEVSEEVQVAEVAFAEGPVGRGRQDSGVDEFDDERAVDAGALGEEVAGSDAGDWAALWSVMS